MCIGIAVCGMQCFIQLVTADMKPIAQLGSS